jgi:FG-GAP-like repeat
MRRNGRRLLGLGVVVATGALLAGCNLGVKPVIYDVSGAAVSGDFDDDGDIDVFMQGGDGYRMMVGDGSGGFTVTASHDGLVASSLAVGDANGDGHPDVFASTDGNSAFPKNTYLLLGDGDGGFATPAPVGDGGEVRQVGLADVDGDGDDDAIEATMVIGLDDLLVVRPGDGAGGFGAPSQSVIQPDFSASEIVVDDLDADGYADVVVSGLGWDDHGNQGFVGVFRGDGGGGLAPVELYPSNDASTNPIDVVIADFDEDGDVDMVTGNTFTNNMSLFRGDGHGGFAPQEAIPVHAQPAEIAAADLDRDGHLDLVYGAHPSSSVVFGDGSGQFTDRHVLETAAGNPFETLARDLDGDGRTDVILSNSDGTAVHLNRLQGRPNH